jgi:DMSO/TMAO reductase YedYZ heme-binding membrane subunit
VGSAAADKIMDIKQARLAHQLTTVFVYGGVGTLVILFTGFALHAANTIVKQNSTLAQVPIMTISIVAYLLILVLVAASWIEGFRVDQES